MHLGVMDMYDRMVDLSLGLDCAHLLLAARRLLLYPLDARPLVLRFTVLPISLETSRHIEADDDAKDPCNRESWTWTTNGGPASRP